jgi:hypothetical protein
VALITAPVALAFGDFDPQLCARSTLEHVLTHRRVDFPRELDHWRDVLESARRGDFAHVMQHRGGVYLADPPEGNSWERWAAWVELRLAELAKDPTTVAPIPEDPGSWQWRSGEIDEASRERVRARLREVQLPAVVSRRDYLVVDVGSRIGSAVSADRLTGEVTTRDTSRVGIVLERGEGVRVVGLHATDPHEDPRAAAWRRQWPALASALGGWFSEPSLTGVHPWVRQSGMLREESEERLAQLAVEGSQLLELGDEDLRAAAVGMGCYVEPSYLRLWLEWMFWRIGYFDWT